MVTNTRRRLFFDIETAPNIGFFWKSGYKLSVSYDNIIQERAIICICWKWEGQKRVYSLKWNGSFDDKSMIEEFLPVLNSADEVVGHNGDRFDVKWLRTRAIKHDIPMMPNILTIDTLKQARSKFYFNSNRLDYIAQYLGLGKKHAHGGFDLWKDIVLAGELAKMFNHQPVQTPIQAMKVMVDYCKQDVLLLEAIWERFNSYVEATTSVAEYPSQCPECGSDETYVNKRYATKAGSKRLHFKCRACGKPSTIAASRFDKDKASIVR